MIAKRTSSTTLSLPRRMMDEIEAEGHRGSTRCLHLAMEALKTPYAVLLMPAVRRGDGDTRTVKIKVPGDLAYAVDQLHGTRGIKAAAPLAEIIGRLAYSGWIWSKQDAGVAAREMPATDHEDPRHYLAKITSPTLRDYQQAFCSHVFDAVAAHRIVPLEGATGTGKSLIIAASAVCFAASGKRVQVAGPTHRVLTQIARAITGTTAPWVTPERIRVAVVLGRQGFISELRLARFIDRMDEEVDETDKHTEAALRLWMRSQQGEDAWRSEAFQRAFPDLPWARLIVTSASDETEDEGAKAYRAQFTKAQGSNIILATHAMLAIDTRLRMMALHKEGIGVPPDADTEELIDGLTKRLTDPEVEDRGLLPPYDVLLVDEAHQLQATFKHIFADATSLKEVVNAAQRIGEHSPKARAIAQRLDQRMQFLRQSTSRTQDNSFVLGSIVNHDPLHEALVDISELLESFPARKKGDADTAFDMSVIQNGKMVLRQALNASRARGRVVTLSFSPIRRFPSVTIAPRSVRKTLIALWTRVAVKGGGGLFSATLYLPESIRGDAPIESTRYVITTLLSLTRRLRYDPHDGTTRYNPDWVTRPVTLCHPKVDPGGAAEHPLRAHKDTKEDLARWGAVMAALVAKGIPGRPGHGTLILCSSYLAVEAIHAALVSDIGPASELRPLITSKPGVSISRPIEEMETCLSRRQAPIWVATGAAWTGLDLEAPEIVGEAGLHSSALRDLVIPRLPFGPPTGQEGTGSQDSFRKYIVPEMLMMLRQGIGRLVRRPDTPPCTVWLLDPRAFDTTKHSYQPLVAKLLERYRKKPFRFT